MASLGVSATTQVVAYDATGGMYAGRLWFLMRWLGHAAVVVLDGGLTAWRAAGRRPKRETAPSSTPAHPIVFAARTRRSIRSSGHLPAARNCFFRDDLTAEGRFKAPDVLRAKFAAVLGFRPASAIIAQCGPSVTACHNPLAPEVAGLSGAALYPGSWSEWSAQPGAPVAQGET